MSNHHTFLKHGFYLTVEKQQRMTSQPVSEYTLSSSKTEPLVHRTYMLVGWKQVKARKT